MAFTPGPWELAESGLDFTVISEEQHQPVAVALVYGSLSGDDIGDPQDNARLVIAAPDLLAACEAALKEWYVGDDDENREAASQAQDMLAAAIAKARA